MGTRKSGSGAIREPPIRAPSPMTLRRAIWTSVTCKTPKPFHSRIPAIEQEPTKRTEVWKKSRQGNESYVRTTDVSIRITRKTRKGTEAQQ
jgi:hypothetical protein